VGVAPRAVEDVEEPVPQDLVVVPEEPEPVDVVPGVVDAGDRVVLRDVAVAPQPDAVARGVGEVEVLDHDVVGVDGDPDRGEPPAVEDHVRGRHVDPRRRVPRHAHHVAGRAVHGRSRARSPTTNVSTNVGATSAAGVHHRTRRYLDATASDLLPAQALLDPARQQV
jgi:hypothetical protein